MSRICEICGKGRQIGNQMTTRGRAKRLKGVGTKVTGITRREFRPNLQNVRITTENGTNARPGQAGRCRQIIFLSAGGSVPVHPESHPHDSPGKTLRPVRFRPAERSA